VNVHLLGIGGAGLSAIAKVLLEMGLRVSGSDRQISAVTRQLVKDGATVFPRQKAENLTELAPEQHPDVVLISSAIDANNPEFQAAKALDLPIVKRAQFLPVLLAHRDVIAIAGTHGKSTTTSMIVKILTDANLAPGYIVGADLPGQGSASAGSSSYFVIEADEYDRMFHGLYPKVAVVTNVEWDHPDCYPTPASFRKAFRQFVDNVEREGLIVSCGDDEGAERLREHAFTRGPRWITYGLAEQADIRATNLRPMAGHGYCADLVWWNAPTGKLELAVPGLHNIYNALAALAATRWCNVTSDAALASLAEFQGVERRFEVKGEIGGVVVIDDYAHHPTEIAATLAAARQRFPGRPIWAIFQPHTFSRTHRMLYRMGESFEEADHVIVTDIFAAREADDGSVHADELVIASPHPDIQHIAFLEEVSAYLVDHVQPGEVIITLGAGDSYRIGEQFLKRYQSQDRMQA
jgi:UDP-N-acetylmuramate--alanine ligase